MACPSPPFWLDYSNYIWRSVKFTYETSHSVISNLPSLHLSSVQLFPSAPCSQTPSVCSTLNVRDQVSQPQAKL
jgi:hypothetical protein